MADDMRSPRLGLLLQVALLATALAPACSFWDDELTTQRPDLCDETALEEARTLLRDAVTRMGATLPESIPAPDVTSDSYTLYNGTLSPLRLAHVNVTAEDAVCRADVRHFPFAIGVGGDASISGIYEYYFTGNNVTASEDRGRIVVTYRRVVFQGKLSQHLGHTSASSSDGTTSTSPTPVWNARVTLKEDPSFWGTNTRPEKVRVNGLPYFDMMRASDQRFGAIFYKLPQTHVLPALKKALGIEQLQK
ncbi:uncharacterized protein LOC119464939 [Dermacentor silvarum]|uniref:uncharacterized protein LOC119464939 n=1 Tax=Dermacentor silvarum TaxID=543639 RepID=UPI0018975FF2|nr:uncharacterized protein LOC119464939 [Dermacentor silvarum]